MIFIACFSAKAQLKNIRNTLSFIAHINSDETFENSESEFENFIQINSKKKLALFIK